jgi:F0F1-type ATP synthase assembly protein I
MTQMSDSQRMLRIAWKYSALGIEMGVAVGVCAWAGIWADKRFGTGQWLMWVGLVIGFGAAVRAVQRTIRDYKRDIAASSGGAPTNKELN